MPPTPDRRRPPPGPVPLDLPDDSGVPVSKLGIWFGLLGLGLLLIVSFEVGFRLGRPKAKKVDPSEVASNTSSTTTPTTPSRSAVPTTKGGTTTPTTPKAKPTPPPVTPTAKAKTPTPPP